MAITTLSGIVSGLQPEELMVKGAAAREGIFTSHTSWYLGTRPAAGVAPTSGMGGAALTAPVLGAFPFQNPASGNAYLARLTHAEHNSGAMDCMFLCDRLWDQSGIDVTVTTAQAIASAAWPARDNAGSTNGEGVLIAVEVSAATGNAGAVTNMTLDYTNQAGTAGRTGTIPSTTAAAGFPATATAGSFVPFMLDSGDTGVRSIENITLGTSLVSGAIHLVAFRFIGMCAPRRMESRFVAWGERDPIGLCLPRIFNSSVLFHVVMPNNTSSTGYLGRIQFTHG